MTWVDESSGGENDLLALQPETYTLWRHLLGRTWKIVDPSLLELCRARMAETYGRPAAAATGELTERDRDALEYVEQLMIDQNGITQDQKDRLARHMSPGELADFTFAAYSNDADLRARTLLGIEADAQPADGDLVFDDDAELFPFPGVDEQYSELLGRFGNDACRQSLVDATTSEVCRLRNATHQQCHY